MTFPLKNIDLNRTALNASKSDSIVDNVHKIHVYILKEKRR